MNRIMENAKVVAVPNSSDLTSSVTFATVLYNSLEKPKPDPRAQIDLSSLLPQEPKQPRKPSKPQSKVEFLDDQALYSTE